MIYTDDIFIQESSLLAERIALNLTKAKRGVGFLKTLKNAYIDAIHMNMNPELHWTDMLPVVQHYAKQVVYHLNIGVKTHGQIPNKPALYVSNHVSWLDPAVFSTVMPAVFIAKAETANWPVLGSVVKAAGSVFIKRGSGDALNIANQLAQSLQINKPIMFFPEGTTSDGTGILKLHGKLLNAALISQRPVQPFIVLYQDATGAISRAVPFCGTQTFMQNLKAILGHQGITAHIKVLDAISPDQHTQQSLTELLKQRMDTGFAQLCYEIMATRK